MKDNKPKPNPPILLKEIMILLALCRPVFNQQRVFNRVLALVMAELFAFGRRTITQLLLTLGLIDEDWTAWYRLFNEKRFDEEGVSRVMLLEALAELVATEPFVVGSDGFHVPRVSQKMPGTGWMRGLRTAKFKPGIQRGQRFVEGSWFTPLHNGYSRAIPLRCLSAFTEKSVKDKEPARTEVAASLIFLNWTRQVMAEAGRGEQPLITLHDGGFDTLAFWDGLPDNTHAVVRTARNRALYQLPAADAHGNCKYGEKAPAPHKWLKKRKGFTKATVNVRGWGRPMRYRVEGSFVRDGLPNIPLFLIVVGGGKRPKGSRRKRYQPSFFLVSAQLVDEVWSLPLPLPTLLEWLWQRWELEVAHRQMKTGLGLGEKQCWNEQATVASVQWSVWVYALIMLSAYRVWKNEAVKKPPGLWRKPQNRWSFNTACRQIRAEMWNLPDFRATWTWSRDNWPINEPLWLNLFNTTLASTRV